MPNDLESIRALCLDDAGNPKEKTDCRALLINHFILDELSDVDEAEEKTEAMLNELGLWKEEELSNEQPAP